MNDGIICPILKHLRECERPTLEDYECISLFLKEIYMTLDTVLQGKIQIFFHIKLRDSPQVVLKREDNLKVREINF